MHDDRAPGPVYHRDIQASNIIKRMNGPGWFLVDWSDATTAPTRAVTHLTESGHSPRVREDSHGPEVDIWGIGKYMEDLCGYPCLIAKPEAVKEMARRWMDTISTTAAHALNEIEVSTSIST